MRTQTTVITKLGTFNGDVKDDYVKEARYLSAQGFALNCLWLRRGDETIYFSANMIGSSVLIFDSQKDEK